MKTYSSIQNKTHSLRGENSRHAKHRKKHPDMQSLKLSEDEIVGYTCSHGVTWNYWIERPYTIDGELPMGLKKNKTT